MHANPRVAARDKTGRLPWLDWLRFLAAFAVLLMHVRGVAFVEYGALPVEQRNPLLASVFLLARFGREAVLLFFVLSGFLVGGRLFDRAVTGEFRALDYSLDRASRIFIPLLPALALTIVAAWLMHQPVGWLDGVANVIGLQEVLAPALRQNDPLWSLSFEIWFYVLGGCLAWLVQAQRLALFPALLFIASLGVFTELGGSFLFCWLVGAVAWRIRPRQFLWAAMGCGLVLVAAGSLMIQLNRDTALFDKADLKGWLPETPYARLVLASGYAMVIQHLILRPAMGGLKWFERFGGKLAAASYTLYLTHYPVLALLKYWGWQPSSRIDLRSLGRFLGVMSLTLVVTWLFYFLFESRTAAARRWARTRLTV